MPGRIILSTELGVEAPASREAGVQGVQHHRHQLTVLNRALQVGRNNIKQFAWNIHTEI